MQDADVLLAAAHPHYICRPAVWLCAILCFMTILK